MASVTPRQVYDALTRAGASTVQAAGIMANMINESGLDPESSGMDSNGYGSYGLVQWNAKSYPGAAGLVTGNPQADLNAQVRYLAQTGGFAAASGATPAQAAGNFAAGFERCQGCQQGGAQWNSRVANAATVTGWAATGQWPSSAGTAQAVAAAGNAGAPGADCLFSVGGGKVPILFGLGPSLPSACLFTRREARALVGGLLMVPALIVGITGLVILAAAGLGRSGAAEKTGGALSKAGAGLALVPGGQAAGLALNRGGAAVRGAGRGQVARKPKPKPKPPQGASAGQEEAPGGTRADHRGTSPEFRRQFLGESP